MGTMLSRRWIRAPPPLQAHHWAWGFPSKMQRTEAENRNAAVWWGTHRARLVQVIHTTRGKISLEHVLSFFMSVVSFLTMRKPSENPNQMILYNTINHYLLD